MNAGSWTELSIVTGQESAGDRASKWYGLLLLASLITFSGAWYWGVGGLTDFETTGTKPLGVPFHYSVWGSIVVATAVYVAKYGGHHVLATFAPFLPFWSMGLVSGVIGINPAGSFRQLAFWLLMASSAAVTGAVLPRARTCRIVFYALLVEMLMSVFLAVLVPDVGTMRAGAGGETFWKGAFSFKNNLGAMASWSVIAALIFKEHVARGARVLLLLAAAACLLKAKSSGALLATFATCGYVVLLLRLRRMPLSAGVKISLVMFVFVTVGLSKLMIEGWLLELLGKDASLTGRTDIWELYLDRTEGHLLLGQGPGAFTGPSEITQDLYQRLIRFGAIRTPHSMYIGVLGDGGIVGALLYLGVLVYLTFVVPVRDATMEAVGCAAVGMRILFAGLAETNEIYGAGIGGLLLVLLYSVLVKSKEDVVSCERNDV